MIACLALVLLAPPDPGPVLAAPPPLTVPSTAPVSTGTKDLFTVSFAPLLTATEEVDPSDMRRVARTVRAQVGALQRCYERLLKSQQVVGRTAIELTIGRDGRPQATRVAEDSLTDRAIAPCFERVIRRMRFPASAEPITVTLPFVFQASDVPAP